MGLTVPVSAVRPRRAGYLGATGHNGQGLSLRSADHPSGLVRHYDHGARIASHGGSHDRDSATALAGDTRRVTTSPGPDARDATALLIASERGSYATHADGTAGRSSVPWWAAG